MDIRWFRVATFIANGLIDFVSRADGLTLALVVFILVLAESLIVTDLFVPGEVGLVVAGAAAAVNGTPLGLVICAAALGAVCGDTAGYVVGRRYGTDVITSHRWGRRLRPALSRARRAFANHGIVIVAAARWVGALRGVIPVVAGSARVPAPRFYAPAVPSAIAWATTVAALGYIWGDDIADGVDHVGLLISVVVVAATVAVIWWRRSGRPQTAS